MCRYSYSRDQYKAHFACFDCRKAFKKTSFADWVEQKGLGYVLKKLQVAWHTKRQAKVEEELGTTLKELQKQHRKNVCSCPQCGEDMASMGLDFRPPKQAATEEWAILRLLYEHGFAFHGCGCAVGYAPPKKASDLESFLLRYKRPSEGEALLAKIQAAGKSLGSKSKAWYVRDVFLRSDSAS